MSGTPGRVTATIHWSSASELTEKSIANGGRPVDCLELRAAWQSPPPLGIVTV